MIVDLPSTTTAAVSKKLVRLRNDVGAMALGRVLTLLIIADESDADEAIEAANDASRQHPCRIIAIVTGNKRGASRLDAQIRVGGDAGASEVVVLRLYGALADHGDSVVIPLLLPDSPVVAWWPRGAPGDVSADPIGGMAQRRITDAAEARNPHKEMQRRAATYQPGDTDLAWTRVTLWRGLLAAALDQPPYEPVLSATVTGGSDSPSTDLLAGWLALTLRCPVTRARTRPGTGMVSVRLERRSGDIDLVRPDGVVATLAQPGQPVRRITLSRRQLAECLADELRRLDPDEIYAESLTRGLSKVGARRSMTSSEAIAEGEAPSIEEARKQSRRVARKENGRSSAAMVSAPTPPDEASGEAVKAAAAAQRETRRSGTPAAATSPPATRVTAPAAKKPAAKKPVARKPVAKKPAARKSAAAAPAATKVEAAKSATKAAVKTPAATKATAKKTATKAPAATKATAATVAARKTASARVSAAAGKSGRGSRGPAKSGS